MESTDRVESASGLVETSTGLVWVSEGGGAR